MSDKPSVWIGCLACYNAGQLVGEWFECDEASAAQEWMDSHEQRTGHEEYECMDTDNLPCGTVPWTGEDVLTEWADAYDTVTGKGANPDLWRAYLAWHDDMGVSDPDPSGFEDAYCGEYDSELDYTYELVEDMGMLHGVDEQFAAYFDYDAFKRDLFMSDYSAVPTDHGTRWIFRSY